MAKRSFPKRLDDAIMDAIETIQNGVEAVYPSDEVIDSVFYASFDALSLEQRQQVIAMLGTEWYLKMAAKSTKAAV